jgi:hypothetical protein
VTSQFASPSSEGDFAVVSAAAGAYALRLKKEFVATVYARKVVKSTVSYV